METRRPPRLHGRTPRNRLATAGRLVELVADAATLVLRLRDKPTALDWLALATCGAGLAHRVWSEASAMGSPDPGVAFATEGPKAEWETASPVFAGWFIDHAREVHAFSPPPRDTDRVVYAKVGEEQIGWIENVETCAIERGPYFLTHRREQTLAALGEALWAANGSRHLTVSGTGLSPGLVPSEDLATCSLAQLEARLRKFRRVGASRAVLLLGPPGTGKSTAAGQLAERLGACSVRIDVEAMGQVLATANWRHDGVDEPCHNLDAIIECLRPDTLLLDDIDRLELGSSLLALVERARRRCPLIIATANCDGGMLGALLRPGRFDEIVAVERPDPRVVRRLLGEDADLADRMASWPIAWIVEFVARRDALGREEARAEIDDLERRMEDIGERTRVENERATRRLRTA